MESIAFKEEEKEGGGERKQVKGKTASLSHILFFFQAQRAGEKPGSRRQQGAALPSTGQKKNPRSNHSERKSSFSSFFDPPPKWERMWQPGGINEGVRGYKISCTKCAGLENMPGNAAFSPALGAIATAVGHARHTGSTQASTSLDWCSLLDPKQPSSEPTWVGSLPLQSLLFKGILLIHSKVSPPATGPGAPQEALLFCAVQEWPVASMHLGWEGVLPLRKHCLYKQKRLHPLAYMISKLFSVFSAPESKGSCEDKGN